MISLLLLILVIIIFLHGDRDKQFIIFSLSIFFFFSFGKVRSIPGVAFSEVLTIIFFVLNLNDLIPLKNRSSKKLIDTNGIRTFFFALMLLMAAAVISYLNNEILVQNISNTDSTGIKRVYFSIFNSILIFASTLIYLYLNFETFDVKKWLNLIIILTILIGILRIFSFIYSFQVPFLAGGFNYNPGAAGQFPFRLTTLERICAIGIPALMANYKNMKSNHLFLSILIFISFIFLNGGRVFWVSMIFTMIVFILFYLKGKSASLLVITGIIVLFSIVLVPQDLIDKQVGRLIEFDESLEQSDPWRYKSYLIYLNNFYNSPITGKGIADYSGFILSTKDTEKELKFVREQAFSGGHGSYISIISTFGLIGLSYLIIFLLYGIFMAFRKSRYYLYANSDPEFILIATFVLFSLILKSINYITAYNGFSDESMFLLGGLIAGLRIFENRIQ